MCSLKYVFLFSSGSKVTKEHIYPLLLPNIVRNTYFSVIIYIENLGTHIYIRFYEKTCSLLFTEHVKFPAEKRNTYFKISKGTRISKYQKEHVFQNIKRNTYFKISNGTRNSKYHKKHVILPDKSL